MGGSVIFANKGAEKIYGYSRSELIGKRVASFILKGREEAKEIKKLMEAKGGSLLDYETQIHRKDGKVIPVSFSFSFLKGKDGEAKGVLSISKDISERKNLQYQLMRTEKLASIGELAAGVAHEINNPLAGILGYAQFILEQVEKKGLNEFTAKIYSQYLSYIEREAQRCKTIVQNLLRFSRADRAEHTSLDINTVVEDTLVFTKHQLEMHKISLIKNLEPTLPEIRGNTHQLQQVLTNLVINARQAMPEGGTLTISTRFNAETVEVEIKDTGCGIPEENLNKIFDPFFTTRKAGEGTGLGLSVSYGIVKEHGGQLTVKSKVGEGTTFLVSLPRKEAPN
jgi:PAS domain S-box-containing protein